MIKEEINVINPLQPYVIARSEDYKEVAINKYGISNFYEFKIREEFENKLQAVPDGSVDLLFTIGSKDVKTYIGGTVLEAKNWPLYDGRTYFGVRFQPGKCILPKELSIKEVVDADLEIDGDYFGSNISEKIAEASSINKRACAFLEKYMNLYENEEISFTNNLEVYIRNEIYKSKGNISIKELSNDTGYSECYIRRIFEKKHGISPKVFEKFVRFQNVLNCINKKSQNYTIEDIALDCGYYDASHMMKDFKCFTGITPESYFNMMLEAKCLEK